MEPVQWQRSPIHCVNFEDIIDSFANAPLLRKFNFVNIFPLFVKICKNLLRDMVSLHCLFIGSHKLLMLQFAKLAKEDYFCHKIKTVYPPPRVFHCHDAPVPTTCAKHFQKFKFHTIAQKLIKES